MKAVDDDWRACTGKCSTDTNPLLFKTGQPLFCIQCGALTRLANGWKPTLAWGDPRHGTENGYKNLLCRCEDCSEAHREYQRSGADGYNVASKSEWDKEIVTWLAQTRSKFQATYGSNIDDETGERFRIDY